MDGEESRGEKEEGRGKKEGGMEGGRMTRRNWGEDEGCRWCWWREGDGDGELWGWGGGEEKKGERKEKDYKMGGKEVVW